MLYYHTGLIHIGSHHVRLLCFYESLFESLYHKGHIYIYSCTFISNVQFKCLLWIALIITVFTNTEQDMAFGVLLHAVHHKQEIRILKMCKNEIWPIYIPHDDYWPPKCMKTPPKSRRAPKKGQIRPKRAKKPKKRVFSKSSKVLIFSKPVPKSPNFSPKNG